MFFDDISKISTIAQKHGTSIFILPDQMQIDIKEAITIQPEAKSVITIEQVRDVLSHLNFRQTSPRFIIFRPADKMQNETANAILKNLEEPKANIHYILVTSDLSKILPTIISRSAIYILRQSATLNLEISQTEEIKDIARRLIVAKNRDPVTIMEEITKHKNKKEYAKEVLATTIEMLYKSYLINQNPTFLKKLPKFITAYENISANGNIKLHLVADLC